eukprot:scaffold3431_cov128-Isochrysis_galbana.AAC.5
MWRAGAAATTCEDVAKAPVPKALAVNREPRRARGVDPAVEAEVCACQRERKQGRQNQQLRPHACSAPPQRHAEIVDRQPSLAPPALLPHPRTTQ